MIMSSDIEQRYRQLFDENYSRLVFHALRFVDSEAEAEDIVADVFYELWKRIGTIDTESGITAYLYRYISSATATVPQRKLLSDNC